MLHIALLGLGRHGQRYAQHLFDGDVPGARLSVCWRRDAVLGRADAARWGARFEPDLEAAVASADAVIAVVPAGMHLQVARIAALARKPLLLEKPLARTAAEGAAICELFESAQTPLTVAQTLRFDPLTEALREKAAALGTLRGFSFEQRIEPRGLVWEEDPQLSGGGVLLQTGIHTVDAVRVICGEPRLQNAVLERVHYQHHEDHALLVLRTATALGTVATSKIGGARHVRFALYLDQGGLEADYIGRRLIEVRGRSQQITSISEAPTVARVAAAWVKFLRAEGPNPVPGRDALRSLALVDAAYQKSGGNNTTAPDSKA